MALIQYKSYDPSKYHIVEKIKNASLRNSDVYSFNSYENKFKFLTHNKILVRPEWGSLTDRASIIDFDLESQTFDIYNSNIPTFQEIADRFNITVDTEYMYFNIHSVHDNRVIIGNTLTETSSNSDYHKYIIVYDYVKDQVIDIFEADKRISTQCNTTFYNDKMRYFIYVNGHEIVKIHDVKTGIELRHEWPYTNVIVVDNKTSYLYLIHNLNENYGLMISVVSLTTLKSVIYRTNNICAKIRCVVHVSYKDNYLLFSNGFNWYAIYMDGNNINTLRKINKILSNGYDFVKIENGLLYIVNHALYGIYNIAANKLESYKINFNEIIYKDLCDSHSLTDIQALIGIRLYASVGYNRRFCVGVGKIFRDDHDLLKFFKKNKSTFGGLIHSNRFERGLLKLIVSFV